MHFFRSVFTADPDPSDPQTSLSHSPAESQKSAEREERLDKDLVVAESSSSKSASAAGGGGVWSFGGLIKTIATRSESVIETYRRDLEEFGSGLKQETVVFREAIRDLPSSLEARATVAQGSLEAVGQAIDGFGSTVWRGTAGIISQGRDALLADEDSDSSDAQDYGDSSRDSGRSSRFEASVHALQSDVNTFSEKPEDVDDFDEWKLGVFTLEEKADEIESLCGENGVLEGMYGRIVPSMVDHETFWFRYFYKVHKLKQGEDARANLVERVASGEEGEELSWEVDDEEEEKSGRQKVGDGDAKVEVEKRAIEASDLRSSCTVITDKGCITAPASIEASDEKIALKAKTDSPESNNGVSAGKPDETSSDGKAGDSSKDSYLAIVSSQRSSHEEDDLGWDEIEDLGDNGEKKESVGGSPNKIDLWKRLSVTEEEGDLSWDIEED